MGNKLELIRHLDSIARMLGSPRPNTVIWRKGDPLPEKTVLKRTHSDQQLHVLMHREALLKLNTLDDGPDGAQWFAQDYVDLLCKVGEWKVVMAGGSIIYVVHAVYKPKSKNWAYNDIKGYLSLREMR